EPALYVLPCLGVLTLTRIRDREVVLRDMMFYGVVGTGLAATFAADYWATGDALNRLRVQLPQSASATGPLSETLLDYLRMGSPRCSRGGGNGVVASSWLASRCWPHRGCWKRGRSAGSGRSPCQTSTKRPAFWQRYRRSRCTRTSR